jgi:hypothetical protein
MIPNTDSIESRDHLSLIYPITSLSIADGHRMIREPFHRVLGHVTSDLP